MKTQIAASPAAIPVNSKTKIKLVMLSVENQLNSTCAFIKRMQTFCFA